jgi:hypothetical protein
MDWTYPDKMNKCPPNPWISTGFCPLDGIHKIVIHVDGFWAMGNPEPWGNHFSSACAERGGGGAQIVGGAGVGWVEDVPMIGISQIPVRLEAVFFGDVGWGWEGTGSRRCSRRRGG